MLDLKSCLILFGSIMFFFSHIMKGWGRKWSGLTYKLEFESLSEIYFIHNLEDVSLLHTFLCKRKHSIYLRVLVIFLLFFSFVHKIPSLPSIFLLTKDPCQYFSQRIFYGTALQTVRIYCKTKTFNRRSYFTILKIIHLLNFY